MVWESCVAGVAEEAEAGGETGASGAISADRSCVSSLNPVLRSTPSNSRMRARAARPCSPICLNASETAAASGSVPSRSACSNMASPSWVQAITDWRVSVTSLWIFALIRSRSTFAASTCCRRASSLSACSRACKTSASLPLVRFHIAATMAIRHMSPTVTKAEPVSISMAPLGRCSCARLASMASREVYPMAPENTHSAHMHVAVEAAAIARLVERLLP